MFCPVKHELEGLAAERFLSVARHLKRLQKDRATAARLVELCQQEVAWARQALGLDGFRDKYEATMRVLVDLAKLRWRVVEDRFGIELDAPPLRVMNPAAIDEYKEIVRAELKPQLDQQLKDQSVQEFIKRMEKPAAVTKRRPITDLIADGRELRTRLLAASEAGGAECIRLCSEAVKPYLQLVEADRVDEFTTIPLGDMWRYFRYTWSIPTTNIPGRQLFYLVRDAAHSCHAVMGIAALSNAPLSLKERDDILGWTATATIRRIEELVKLPPDQVVAGLHGILADLEENIAKGLESVSHQGLLQQGDLENPSDEVVQRLRRRANEFSAHRQEILKEMNVEQPLILEELEEVEYGMPDVSDEVLRLEEKVFGDVKMDAARRALTAKKRAGELARLLQARMTLWRHRKALLDPATCLTTARREDVTVAINTAWVAAKSARAGTNMLEITTCGAIPPYNHILGGKLVALLMLSPEVADDYRHRYGASTSIISSMMKNAVVVKDSRLVFLGTTSLYAHGASQYNRLRLPAGTIAADQPEIRFTAMGQTSGFGTVQFPLDTVSSVERVVQNDRGYKEVNSVFGEGRSPKLRKLRTGLRLLGFDPSVLMQHHQPRLIFGVPLFSDAGCFLLTGGGEVPEYVQHPDRFRDATPRIAAYWCERWLARRLNHEPVLASLEKERAWRLGLLVPTTTQNDAQGCNNEDPHHGVSMSTVNSPSPGLNLWRSLASAGHDTCSDGLSSGDINRLHIPSTIEQFLFEKAREGFSVILTGNAGDGKTHLLRGVATELAAHDAVVDLDATAIMRRGSTAPILDRWRRALAEGRSYWIAANEYPLYRLLHESSGNLPANLFEELSRQCRHRLVYGEPSTDEEAQHKLLIMDLSLRNPLSGGFVASALDKMLSDSAVRAFAESGGDPTFCWNYTKLSHTRVKERLVMLCQRLAERGHRATIRELWIVLAKILFGPGAADADAPALSPRTWYSERLFRGETNDDRFRLFQLLKQLTDPAACSHPRWDWMLEECERIWTMDWLDSGVPTLDLNHRDPAIALERFRAVKRCFYFEHASGAQVFDLEPPEGTAFRAILRQAGKPDEVFKGEILRAINLAYCPKAFSGCDRDLHLWVGHRYHEQPTRCYVANRSIPAAAFTIHLPRLPQRLAGAFDYLPDHFVLECREGDRAFRLKVDAALYATLMRLGSGFPRHLAPESDLNKLDDFLARLQTTSATQGRQFVSFSGESRLATRITLSDDFSSYTDIEEL
ncbi:MAG: Druantia anti-phage system protein DruA [Opitutaceae bacterium]